MIIPTPVEQKMMPMPPTPKPFSAVIEDTLASNGVFYLDSAFENKHIIPICKGITALNMIGEKPESIKLMINSPGGSVASCQQLLHTMAASKIPIETHAIGLAASCGILTFMAGTPGMRYAYEGATIMSHVYSTAMSGKEGELIARRKSNDDLSRWMENHYKKHTKKSVRHIRKHLLPELDVWLTPEECVEHNIADHVVTA